MTLEAWVNPAVVSSAWRDIIEKGNDNYYLMGTTTLSSAPGGGGTFGGATVTAASTIGLPASTWTHIATTYDGATLRLYINGVQVSILPRTGAIAISTSALEIGGDSIFGQFFQGIIDEVRIYNVALAPTQIQADMNSPTGGSFPSVNLNPSTVSFGSLSTGTTSAPQVATLTNTGGSVLGITGITLTGINNSDFSQTNNCGASLASNASCTITVTFTPAAAGTRSASIRIDDNAAGTPHAVALTGTGVGFSIAPRVSVLTPNLTQPFSVTGGSGGGVIWAVDGVVGGSASTGTISTAGLFLPPSAAGTHTVTVTDGTQVSSATVYVTTYSGTFTHHNDNFRTGQNLSETVLNPANVNQASFGKLFSYPLDGLSMASPLYVAGVTIPGQGVHNVVFVATQHDSVYAFDADGLSPNALWKTSFLGPGVTTVPASDTGECCDIAPEIGITGTPVIDFTTGTLYVVAKTKEGSNYVQRLHALDIGTGAEKFGGPVLLQASVPGNGQGSVGGNVPFDALRENQRPALLLSAGVVYIGFGSHGDNQPYHGWVLGYNATTLQQVMAFNVSPNGEGGGIWQANGGPAVDADGNIYFMTGNGTFDTSNTNRKNYGDSFVKISPAGAVVDFFTPHDQGDIDANDFDLGAAGPMLLPDQPGTHPHLVIGAGKNNTMYLVDRDNMGKFNANNDNQIVQSLVNIFPFGTPEPGNYSQPVYFNGTVYFGPIRDNIQAFPLTNGLLATNPTSRSADLFSYPGATLAISANGASNGILWAIQRNGDCGVLLTCGTAAPGVLKAYHASNLAVLLYSSDQAGSRDTLDFATKFSVPLVANGKVFVGSMGQLTAFGLLQ
jgi:concanavalin A-like lectin/glucanase superfamily protein/centrosomal CEP192-like protein